MHIFSTYFIRHIFIQHKHITDFEALVHKKSSFRGEHYVYVCHFLVLPEGCSWNSYDACLWDSMMYLCFIYLCFLICSTLSEKMWFWIWGIWWSCTKCSKLFENIKNAKMQWLAAARKIQEDAILYFIDLFDCFLFALICSKAKLQASVKTCLAHKRQA